jgi:hypothetical protein
MFDLRKKMDQNKFEDSVVVLVGKVEGRGQRRWGRRGIITFLFYVLLRV